MTDIARRPNRMRYPLAAMLAALLLVCCGAGWDDGPLNGYMSEVAKKIKALLDGQNERAIAVGSFTGPARTRSSSGPALTKALADELKSLGVVVDLDAKLEVKGEYAPVTKTDSKETIVKFTGRVIDRQGTSLAEMSAEIFEVPVIAALLGTTVDLKPKDDPRKLETDLKNAIDHPSCSIDGSRVATKRGSPYAVEILVKNKNGEWTPRRAAEDKGQAFVGLEKGEEYAVRLINDSNFEAAATLTIDGLNSFEFSSARKPDKSKFTRRIVAPHTSALVEGWQEDLKTGRAFVITDYAKSAAAEVKSTENVGAITTSFAACWKHDQEPPADEPKRYGIQGPGAGNPDIGTGRGNEIVQNIRAVEREFGGLRAAITVRYAK